MEFAKILVLGVGSAVLYGILQDQVTARLCVEYFTVGHPPVFPTQDPGLLALGWGVIATWWVGILLGLPLALAARCGARPKLSAGTLLKPIIILVICVGASAALGGCIGYLAAKQDWIRLMGPFE